MENNLGILLRAEFFKLSKINQFRFEKDKKKKHRILSMILLLGFVGIIMAGYSFAFSYGFGYLGLADTIPGYALAITSLVILLFTFFKTNGVLFASKDYDLVMALPVKTETVITVKFLSMYLNNLLFAVVVMCPMGIGYGIWKGWSFLSVAMWVVAILIAPLLPMTIAALVGLGVMRVSSGSRHHVFLQVFLTAALIVGIFCGSFWMQDQAVQNEQAFIAKLTDIGALLSASVHKIYPPSAWFDTGLQKENAWYLALYFILSVVIYEVFLTICGRCYRRIHTALYSHHTQADYRMGKLKTNTLMMALVKKEAKRFTSSTVYMTNIGMGLVLALLASVGSLFIGMDKLLVYLGVPKEVNVTEALSYIMPFAIAMLINMCCTTSVSLSLEGKNIWIMQSLPMNRRTILQGKMLFNVLLVLPVSLICSIIFMIQLRVSVVTAVGYLLIAAASVGFSTTFGMWINLRFPNYEWENEVQVIKQGMSSMIAVFGSLIGYIVLGVLAFVLSRFMNGSVMLLIVGVLLAVGGGWFYRCCN